MAGPFAGRKVRIKYDADGAGVGAAVEIARAKTDTLTINNEPIDGTSKDDAGVRTLIDDVGLKSMEMSCSGLLSDQHKTLIGLAQAAGDGTSLQWFEFDMPSVGTFRGQWFISSMALGGNDGAEGATFEASFASSGAITWTPAP